MGPAFDTVSAPYVMTSLVGDQAPNGDYDLFLGLTNPNLLSGLGAVFASSDGGSTWSRMLPASTALDLPVVAAYSSGLLVGASGEGVFQSTDNGTTWAARDSGLVMPPWDGYRHMDVNAFAFSGDTVFAGGGFTASVIVAGYGEETRVINYILSSTDNGATWHPVDSGFTATVFPKSLSDTASLPTCLYADGSNLIVGTKPLFYGRTGVHPYGGGIYRCVNNGSGWTLTDSSLTGRYVYDFTSYGSDVFAATDSGIFRSTDGGATWRSESNGLRDLDVTSLVASDSYMFASTLSGVWKRPLSELTSVNAGAVDQQVPGSYSLSQNYPNPFNPTTVIKFGVRSSGLVGLKVYDVLGRLVKTLVEKVERPGNYEVRFDGEGMSSGVYFCRMQAGGYSRTVKMLLLK